MSDLSQTPGNVGLTNQAGSPVLVVQVGENVSQGMPGYRLLSDGKHYQTDGNASAAAAVAAGIFLTPAATNEHAVLALPGSSVDMGGTLVVGTMYWVSATKGAVADAAPASGGYNTSLGMAITTSRLDLEINVSGVDTP